MSTHETANTRTDERLTALEIKASFTEDVVDKLDQIIVRQQRQIDALVAEVMGLRQQVQGSDLSTAARNARDELPPHY